MNRWLLTAFGITVAGSAFGANTATPPIAKARTQRQVVAVRPAPARPPATATQKPTLPTSALLPEMRLTPSPTTIDPAGAAPQPLPTPTAEPASPVQQGSSAPANKPSDARPEPVIVDDREVVIKDPSKPRAQALERELVLEFVDEGQAGDLALGNGFTALGLSDTTPVPLRKVISVDLSNATPVEAIEGLVKQLGGPVALSFDKGIPNETRITLKVKQVSAAALLGLITQNAGLGWSMNVPGKGQTAALRISKLTSPTRSSISFLPSPNGGPGTGGGPVDVLISPRVDSNYLATRSIHLGERRLTLECPHCKVKNTIVRQRSQPKCPKCTRTFQGDWQFCPIDGSKRPGEPNEWKFCPACGKKVEIEKASIEDQNVQFLGDLPIVGELFRNHGNTFQPYAVPAPRLPGELGRYPAFPPTPSAPQLRLPGKPGMVPNPGVPLTPVPAQPAKPLAPTPAAPRAKPDPAPELPATPAPEPTPAVPAEKQPG